MKDDWVRGILVGLFLGLLVGFISGQLFHSWEYGKMSYLRIQKLEDQNGELRKDAVPQRIQPKAGK